MNAARLEEIVNAVLYEGYILYPYRPSAKKNRRERFTFGRVYPESYSAAQQGAEPCLMQTECLVETAAADATLRVSLRFLHPIVREIGQLEPAACDESPTTPAYRLVPELWVGDELYQPWQEAAERRVEPAAINLQPDGTTQRSIPFRFPSAREIEPINRQHAAAGVIVRRQEQIDGTLELTAQPLEPGLYKITARVLNRSALPAGEGEEVLLRTMASTHTVLCATKGVFVSLMDPPPKYHETSVLCQNLGTWPVLVGEEQAGERDTLLSSPIILYDYPQIAPQSAGPLFDSTEIDEILTLRILTLTDAEKAELRRVDQQARRLLERTETLPEHSLRQLHGTLQPVPAAAPGTVSGSPAPAGTIAGSPNPVPERPAHSPAGAIEFDDFFGTSTRLEGVWAQGVYLKKGSRVRVRPKARADLIDLALTGQAAVIEAVEQDLERRVHLALVLEKDPGQDLGQLRQPGHRFFYGVDEIEPLDQEA